MRIQPLYSFTFFLDGERGTVDVWPADAFVRFSGASFQIDAVRGPLAKAIYDARLAHAHCVRRFA